MDTKPLFRTWDLDGLRLHLHRTRAFKTVTARLALHADLDGDAAARAIVPRLLARGTTQSPSLRALQVRLDKNFGATLAGGVRKIGERHLVLFRSDWINNALAGTDLLSAMGDLLGEWIHDPARGPDGGVFAQDVFAAERKMLGDEADAVFDDKSRYARHRLIETMCRGEAYARPSIGRRKEIDALTLDAARAAWRDVVDRAPADLFLVGNLTVAEARRFAKRLALGGRGRLASLRRTVRKPAGRVRTVRESQEVTQAKLEMGFRTSVRHGQKQFPAYVLMNGVFGGTPVGKLFKVVREKASLCYSVYSAPERTKGLMLVHAGIDEKNYAKARRLILRQLDAVRAGEIETEQIEMARSMLVGALRTMRDSPHALIDFALERTVNGVGADLEGLLADLERVTVRDVARVARTVELDSVFLLRS